MDLETSQHEKREVPPTEEVATSTPPPSEPMAFNSWAAQPAPRRRAISSREKIDFEAFKIFLILAGLTAGMALALRSLF